MSAPLVFLHPLGADAGPLREDAMISAGEAPGIVSGLFSPRTVLKPASRLYTLRVAASK